MRRHKNVDWSVPTNANGNVSSWNYVPITVLMDLRDELQSLNAQFRTIREWFHQRGMHSAIRAVIQRENRKEQARLAKLRKARRVKREAQAEARRRAEIHR